MKLGVTYLGSYLPEHVRADLADIRAMGCDEVLVALQENDFRHFPGKVALAPTVGHDLGLRVLANFWCFASAFGGGRMSILLTEEPDTWLLGADGARRGLGCMNHPALLARAREMVDVCIVAGYDGFFWDEPTAQDCYCPHCRVAYAEQVGGELLAAPAEKVAAFRQWSIGNYVRVMSDYVKGRRADLETATCVMPIDRAAWELTAAIPSLDTFGSDPYWQVMDGTLPWTAEVTRDVVSLSRKHGKRCLMWLQGWAMPAGREVEILQAARLIAGERPDALYTWSYRGGLGSDEQCEDPQAAWAQVVAAYRELSGH